MRPLPLLLALTLGACSSAQKPRPPLGALPTAVTTAEPLWIPFRVHAGRAVSLEPRESHFTELRRLTSDGHAGLPLWAPSGAELRYVNRADCRTIETIDLETGRTSRVTQATALESLVTADTLTATECDGAPSAHATTSPHALHGTAPVSLGGITNPHAMPTLSPDHALLSWQAHIEGGADGSTAIFLSAANGARPRQVSHDGLINAHPTFTKDGRRIVYSSDRDSVPNASTFALYLTEPEGPVTASGAARVERLTFGDDRAPRFSPDGRWLAFLSSRGGNGTDLYVARWLD